MTARARFSRGAGRRTFVSLRVRQRRRVNDAADYLFLAGRRPR